MGTTTAGGPRVLVAHPGAELYGSDRVLLDAVIGFVDAGWTVQAVVPSGGPLCDALAEHGVDVQIVPTLVLRKALMKPSGWSQLIGGYFSGRRTVARLLREFRPDLVYVSTITQPLWAPGARALGIATMVHVHEAEASARPFVRKGLYSSVRSADVIVINSEFAKSTMLASYPQLADRARVVWNPVPGPSEIVAPRARIEGPLRVGYVGRLSPRKGVDLVVAAVGSLVADGFDAQLDLLGSAFEGYEWFELELHVAAARYNIEDRVRFHGFRDSVWSVVADLDVLVVPSRFDEPFGNTAVEAALALRPVIVSDTSGLREATRGLPTAMLVTPGSVEEIATAIARIADNWAGVVAHTQDAADIARARHDVTVFRKSLLHHAAEAMAMAPRR